VSLRLGKPTTAHGRSSNPGFQQALAGNEVGGFLNKPARHWGDVAMRTKPCPVRGCGALIRAEYALCSECWRRLPHYVQRAGFFSEGTCWLKETYEEALAYLNKQPPLPTHSVRD